MAGCSNQWQQTPLVNFNKLSLPSTPNYYVVCQTCDGKNQEKSPVYPVSMSQLEKAWQDLIAKQPRVTLLKSQGAQYQYVQRSAFFRFPDIIDVEFIALSSERSSINIFSRSVYGYSDFGVNRKRVQQWVSALKVE
jgi:uncharacterized protein (DUF1499 family)